MALSTAGSLRRAGTSSEKLVVGGPAGVNPAAPNEAGERQANSMRTNRAVASAVSTTEASTSNTVAATPPGPLRSVVAPLPLGSTASVVGGASGR